KRQFPKQFFLVSYNKLNKEPFDTTKKIFDFCKLGLCKQVERFLVGTKTRHDADPYSVYRANARDDSWRGILPDEIVKQIITEIKNTPLDIFVQDGTIA
ncbi:MAG: hypothetical protein P1P89_21990, partial [Desulfobacterales bacterium]|nr:hypothetical protein [Desulfobacterales bacterium]